MQIPRCFIISCRFRYFLYSSFFFLCIFFSFHVGFSDVSAANIISIFFRFSSSAASMPIAASARRHGMHAAAAARLPFHRRRQHIAVATLAPAARQTARFYRSNAVTPQHVTQAAKRQHAFYRRNAHASPASATPIAATRVQRRQRNVAAADFYVIAVLTPMYEAADGWATAPAAASAVTAAASRRRRQTRPRCRHDVASTRYAAIRRHAVSRQ
jgi:hypothetical protein